MRTQLPSDFDLPILLLFTGIRQRNPGPKEGLGMTGCSGPGVATGSTADFESITIHASGSPDGKRRGEAAEAAFLARATQFGFRVLLPWGESNPYDAALDFGRYWLRIQVKSASSLSDGGYTIKTTGCNGHVYTLDEVDFVAGYVIPENIWYIIPLEAIGGRSSIKFRPRSVREPKPIFERYREAWCLLVCSREARGEDDMPAICRGREVGVQCAVCPVRERNLSG